MKILRFFFFLMVLAPYGTGAVEDALPPPKVNWSFSGLFGTFDRAAAQRGFQVYKEVCAACHSISLVRYRNLEEIGFSPEQVKAIAAEYETKDGPNDEAARAANDGSIPIDLSLITKARPHGADYVYALLTGYQPHAPEGITLFPGKYYNPYFPGGQIAMPPSLLTDAVTYADGTPATVEQMAHDVTTFLAWASEPEMEERKQIGFKMLIMFAVLTILLWIIKKYIWKRVK